MNKFKNKRKFENLVEKPRLFRRVRYSVTYDNFNSIEIICLKICS